MSATSWQGLETFSSPASTSTASSGDDFFRSFLSSLALGISTSFIWPGTGGGSLASGGVSQYGNARMARASNSAVTGGYGDGFLLLNQNHVSLHHIGSTWTGLLGHSAMVDHGGGLGSAPFTGRWLTQQGTLSTGTNSAHTLSVTFATQYDPNALCFVQFSQSESSNGYAINISNLSATGFSASVSGLRGVATGTIFWESDGTVLN